MINIILFLILLFGLVGSIFLIRQKDLTYPQGLDIIFDAMEYLDSTGRFYTPGLSPYDILRQAADDVCNAMQKREPCILA